MTDTVSQPLVVKREFAYGREQVFKAFANAEALQQWIAPDNSFETKVLEFNFHTGGHYRIEFILPNGVHTSLSGQYKIINQPKQLSFTWCWEKPDPHAGIESLVTVDFHEKHNATEVVISHIKFTNSEMKQRHSTGWLGTLTRLQTWLEQDNNQAD